LNSSAKCMLAAVVGCALFLGCSGTCAAQQRSQEEHFKCDTAGVQLQGVLTARTFYGPPGFGETPAQDAREKALILKLPKPITVDPIEDVKAQSCWGNFPHLAAVQLFIFPEAKLADARKLVGKEVVATGTLREGDAPSEHTKVILEVKAVEPK
jgi:hypothetical protein